MYHQTKSNRNQTHTQGWPKQPSKWRRSQKVEPQKFRYAMFLQKCKEACDEYWTSVVIPILQETRKELESLGSPPCNSKQIILYCVKIFSIASTCQDCLGTLKIFPYGKYEAVKKFNEDLYYTGRHESNDFRQDTQLGPLPYWNSTKKGEPITLANIFFGPEIGHSRKSANYWLNMSKNSKISVREQTFYAKGSITKIHSIPLTDALVKFGIHRFVRIAYNALIEDLENLLA